MLLIRLEQLFNDLPRTARDEARIDRLVRIRFDVCSLLFIWIESMERISQLRGRPVNMDQVNAVAWADPRSNRISRKMRPDWVGAEALVYRSDLQCVVTELNRLRDALKSIQGKRCECDICKRSRHIRSVTRSGTKAQLVELIRSLHDSLMDAEMDEEYWRVIVDGSWPSADDVIAQRRAKRATVPHSSDSVIGASYQMNKLTAPLPPG